ncbi:hypothetical protein GCM10011578_043820 [Streptomyces fuscichromogenes]|uniref:Uncharacterized protein n=1 Tax=Streptomyces fuscichromogenes TaxID=1324013 RepID=A0A917XEZ3_9ACTN|nr:hypothetical protein GCM10011578_043820 [Streptomyces fuscichromogenes]
MCRALLVFWEKSSWRLPSPRAMEAPTSQAMSAIHRMCWKASPKLRLAMLPKTLIASDFAACASEAVTVHTRYRDGQ